MSAATSRAFLAALAIGACSEQHVPPRTFVADGSVLEGDAFAGGTPAPCSPDGADTMIVGPEPGCVEAAIQGEPFDGDPPSNGHRVRFVDATEGALEVELALRVQCRPDRDATWEVGWLTHDCVRELIGGRCVEEWSEVRPIAIDPRDEDHVFEARVHGERATAHFTLCARAP